MGVNILEKVKLFCLPYAGSSAVVYYKFKKYLSSDIILRPLELAGRGGRNKEPFYETLDEAAGDIYNIIKDEADEGPYAVFGHSLGSIIAYELLNKLEKAGKNPPVEVFFSGSRPPHLLHKMKHIHDLPDAEFAKEVFDMGGTDKKVFENSELSRYFTRILKSDFKIIEEYNCAPKREKFKNDITVLTGVCDTIPFEDSVQWRQYTEGICKIYKFFGNHFFINSETKSVVGVINRILREKTPVLNVR